ncbi:MAG: Thiamine import ATP-binding protein ThiQ [Candidatus Erwinia impunctatus]|nr:Thiamine import ATP-binding protein ThiQ [Culicoides impunctatus]
MLTLNHLTFLYDTTPMRFSFHLQAGEKVALLGPSGAGKSTLLSLIAGFLTSVQGELFIRGEDHTHTPPASRPVSMLFQDNNLFPHLTVEENLALGIQPKLKLNNAQQQRMIAIAERVEMTPFLTRYPAELSGGQRQRIALARCLLRQQPLLLLDEPFSALDPALRYEMLQLVDQVCQEQQLTLLMVSHQPEDAAQIASRALLVVDGQLRWDGSTTDLLQGDVSDAAFLGVNRR